MMHHPNLAAMRVNDRSADFVRDARDYRPSAQSEPALDRPVPMAGKYQVQHLAFSLIERSENSGVFYEGNSMNGPEAPSTIIRHQPRGVAWEKPGVAAGKNQGMSQGRTRGRKPARSSVHGYQALADGVASQTGGVVDIEGFHQLAAVGFRRLGADVELLGNLLGRVAFRDQLQHFALPRG